MHSSKFNPQVVGAVEGNHHHQNEKTSEDEQTIILKGLCSDPLDNLKELLLSLPSSQTVVNKLHIENSQNVHIGNVININGDIHIINVEGTTPIKAHKAACDDEFIVPRHRWLAQKPMAPRKYLQEPVKYVIISHTATENSEVQGINVRLVRDIQCFHIESREWADISYNFLVGCDGNAYEGRGWGVVGAHTLDYNNIALGISFIGCFIDELPTKHAIKTSAHIIAGCREWTYSCRLQAVSTLPVQTYKESRSATVRGVTNMGTLSSFGR